MDVLVVCLYMPSSMWRENGIDTAKSYPYSSALTGVAGKCEFNVSNVGVRIETYVEIHDEHALLVAVATEGPVTAALDGRLPSFRFYKKGVFEDECCYTDEGDANHSVLIVGYGVFPGGREFWLAKNSWGLSWGVSGYILIKRHVNMCGLANNAIYPVAWMNAIGEIKNASFLKIIFCCLEVFTFGFQVFIIKTLNQREGVTWVISLMKRKAKLSDKGFIHIGTNREEGTKNCLDGENCRRTELFLKRDCVQSPLTDVEG